MTSEQLKEYQSISAEVKWLERQLDKLEAAYIRVCNDKLADMKAFYEKKWDKLIDLRIEVESAVEELPPAYRTVMWAKYIDGMTWAEVAESTNYSVANVIRLHNKALKLLDGGCGV